MKKRKKKQYNELVLQLEHRTITPLVMYVTSGMRCDHLSEIISEERKEDYAFIASWVRRNISFTLASSLCTCLRRSRSGCDTSNTFSENSLSSTCEVSEVTSNVDATLPFFWVSCFIYTACHYCVECNIVMKKIW